MPTKISFIIFIFLLELSIAEINLQDKKHQKFYRTQDAQECFHNKALSQCQNHIQECLEDDQCKRQLALYQDCTFEQQQNGEIFNGYCFKKWKKYSIMTKQIINCLDQYCQLSTYNSQISLQLLYACSQQILFSNEDISQCLQPCQQSLKNSISSRIHTHEVAQIYTSVSIRQQLTNPQAKKIVQKIQTECIDQNGEMRHRHEKELLQKQRSKIKLQQRMDSVIKQQVYSSDGQNSRVNLDL